MTADKRDTKMPETLPLWPDHDDHPYNIMGDYTYERARADAAMARLGVAVEALKNIETRSYFDEDGIFRHLSTPGALSDYALDALAAIGPIPEEGKP